MSGRVDAKYGNELFKERKVYRFSIYAYPFVIEDMDEIKGGWRIRRIKMVSNNHYYRDYLALFGTKQKVMAHINEHYSSY